MTETETTSPNDSKPFQGFPDPEQNWSRMPHALIEALPIMTSEAEIKAILYILRHTWGFHDDEKRISIDEFAHGRKRKGKGRIDTGTGLSENAVRAGIALAISHGFIEVVEDSKDKARIARYYRLRSRGSEVDPPDMGGMDTVSRGAEVEPLHSEVEPHASTSEPRSKKETIETNHQKDKYITVALSPAFQLNARSSDGGGDVLSVCMDDLGIDRGSKWREIKAANPSPVFVVAHGLYAAARGKGVGYVIGELLTGAIPPCEFIGFAKLSPDDWRALWRGHHRGEWSSLRPDLIDSRSKWQREFGDLLSVEPFTGQKQIVSESGTRQSDALRARIDEARATRQSEYAAVPDDNGRIWRAVLDNLKLQLTSATFDTWLASTRLICTGENGSKKFTVECHSDIAREWLENRLATMIKRELAIATGCGAFDLAFVVQERAQ